MATPLVLPEEFKFKFKYTLARWERLQRFGTHFKIRTAHSCP